MLLLFPLLFPLLFAGGCGSSFSIVGSSSSPQEDINMVTLIISIETRAKMR